MASTKVGRYMVERVVEIETPFTRRESFFRP